MARRSRSRAAKKKRRPKRPPVTRREPAPAPPSVSAPTAWRWSPPRYSRKTERVTLEALTPSGVCVRLVGSPAAMNAAAVWWRHDKSLQDAFVAGLEQAAEAGPFTRRRQLARIKQAAALTYLDLQYGVPDDLAPDVEWAKDALARGVGELRGFTASDRRILVVAMLVSSSREWKTLGLKDPFVGGVAVAVDSFYKRYIRPGLPPRRFRFLPRPSRLKASRPE